MDNSFEAIKRIENDRANLHVQFKILEQNYAQDTLNLVLATGYLKKLLSNNNVKSYLMKNYPEIFTEFETITKSA